MKLLGRASYMSWEDVARVVRGGPPAISAVSAADVQAGGDLFSHQCSQCHGADARGGSGPDLTSGQFRHGGSDADLLRSITQGVPGTAMLPRSLSPAAVGQVIAFLRSAAAARAEEGSTPSATASASPFDVTFAQLASAARDSGEWLMYSGSYDGQRHSRLVQITRDNVAGLRLKWLYQIPKFSPHAAQTSPLVVGTAMFVTLPPNSVWAIDTRTGKELWSWSGPQLGTGGLRILRIAGWRSTATRCIWEPWTHTWSHSTHRPARCSGT